VCYGGGIPRHYRVEALPRRSLDVPPEKYPLPEGIARHVDYLPRLEIRCTLAYTRSQAQTEIRILPISGRGQGRSVVWCAPTGKRARNGKSRCEPELLQAFATKGGDRDRTPMHMVPLSSDTFCPLAHITRKPTGCGYTPDTVHPGTGTYCPERDSTGEPAKAASGVRSLSIRRRSP
jgi:hypothetical protein